MSTQSPTPAVPTGSQSMSPRTRNAIIIVLAVLVVFCLGACAAFLLAGRSLGNLIGKSVVEDPGQVSTVAADIADFNLPGGFAPKAGFHMLGFTMAMYATSDNQSMITLIQMPTSNTITDEDIQKMRDQSERQAGRQLQNFRILSTKDATIRGEPAKIIIQEGTTDNNVTIRQELVAFSGKSGTALLMVMAPVDQWNQAAYDKMVKSIK
jgi:hypothetical protein